MISATSEVSANAAVPVALQVLDPQSLLDRCMGDASAAVMLLGMFQERLPETIAEIRAGLEDSTDVIAVLHKVHTLKGNAGNLSADRLYQAASQFESALRRKELEALPSRLAELQQEIETLLEVIPRILETLS